MDVNIRAVALAGFIAITSVPAVVEAQGSCFFPGDASICDSPDGTASVEWRQAGPRRQLLLRSGTTKKTTTVFAFDRAVDVKWSPDGRAFAINDRPGLADSSVWIVEVTAPQRRVDIEKVYTAAFGRPPALYRNRHRYFNASGWRSASTLDINIEAYDDGEFHDHVLYHLDGTIERD